MSLTYMAKLYLVTKNAVWVDFNNWVNLYIYTANNIYNTTHVFLNHFLSPFQVI